jgi:hypothetical protein
VNPLWHRSLLRPVCLLAIVILWLAGPGEARQAAGGAPTFSQANGEAGLRVGGCRVAVEPVAAVRGLRVLEMAGPGFLLDGRRAVDVVLSGSSAAPLPPALGNRLTVRTDAGETAELELAPAELGRHPNGREYTARYRLDLSRFEQPFRTVRLEGQLRETGPIQVVTRSIRFPLVRGLGESELGPLQLSAAPAAPVPEGQAPAGPHATVSVACAWESSDQPPQDLQSWREVAGPVAALLRTRGENSCPLLCAVATTHASGAIVRRRQEWVWQVEAGGEAELVLTYPTVPLRTTPFVLERVPVPEAGPPALGRIDAVRMVLDGEAGARMEALLAGEDLPGDAPHPLLDEQRGGTLKFRLRREGRPAGEGLIQAGLASRQGEAWGGWHWFTGRTDPAGEATLANVKPGAYRIRVRFMAVARTGTGSRFSAPDREVNVPARGAVRLTPYDLRPETTLPGQE